MTIDEKMLKEQLVTITEEVITAVRFSCLKTS